MKANHFFHSACLLILSFIACDTPDKKKVSEAEIIKKIDSVSIKLQLVTNAIQTPIEFNVSPGGSGRVFITETQGKIWLLEKDSLLPKPFFNIYDKLGQQNEKSPLGSIASVAFHPLYASNGKFYVCYNAPTKIRENQCKLVVSEFAVDKRNHDLADLASERRVIELEGKNIGANGAQIAFGPDGFLYISIGDDQIGDSTYIYRAQDLRFLNGKILRIDVNQSPYAIPADNPFIAEKDARPEIWAYGFRKVWRFCFDPRTSQLFGADVGELKEEEIDIIARGGNYGWPVKEGDSSFNATNSVINTKLIAPVYGYSRDVGICIIGGDFYQGLAIPELKDKYVFADFNGSVFALFKTAEVKWTRQTLKISNKPADPFLICGMGVDENKEPIVLGFLQTKDGTKGVVYRIMKG